MNYQGKLPVSYAKCHIQFRPEAISLKKVLEFERQVEKARVEEEALKLHFYFCAA